MLEQFVLTWLIVAGIVWFVTDIYCEILEWDNLHKCRDKTLQGASKALSNEWEDVAEWAEAEERNRQRKYDVAEYFFRVFLVVSFIWVVVATL